MKSFRKSFREILYSLFTLSLLFFSAQTSFSQQVNLELGSAQPDWWSAMWSLEKVDDGSDFVRIKNRWQSTSIHNEAKFLLTGNVSSTWRSAMWQLEKVSGEPGFVRIKNRKTSMYLHNENGKLEEGAIQPNWWSAMWQLEPVSGEPGYFRIKNRFKETYLHIQNQKGYPHYLSPTGIASAYFDYPKPSDGGYREFQVEFEINDVAPDHFWAFQFQFQSDNGGYLGFQSNTAGYRVQFSIWDAIGADAAPNGRADAFGHEGEGYACSLLFNWEAGRRYRLTLKRAREDASYAWWSTTVTDLSSGQESLVGTIKTPKSWGGLRNSNSTFVEYFGKQDQKLHPCSDLGYTRALVVFPVLIASNGARVRPTSQSFKTYGPCYNDASIVNLGSEYRVETNMGNAPMPIGTDIGFNPPPREFNFSVANKSIWLISFRTYTAEEGWSVWKNVDAGSTGTIRKTGLVTNYDIEYKDVTAWKEIPGTPVMSTTPRDQSFVVSGNTFSGISMD
jgi:hypothetical protein